MRVAHLFVKQRRAATRHTSDALSPRQIRWLGSLLLATQLSLIAYVPIWIAFLGTALVGLRFLLITRSVRRPGTSPPVIRSWVLGLLALVTAIAIQQSLGYFVGRDPCVAFLFALIGIKYLETRTGRDGTLIVCLACLLIVTPFFYSQSLLAAAAAIPALVLLGGALHVLARPGTLPPMPGGWRAPLAGTLRMLAQGIPLAATLFLLFPRVAGPLWGVPADHSAHTTKVLRWLRVIQQRPVLQGREDRTSGVGESSLVVCLHLLQRLDRIFTDVVGDNVMLKAHEHQVLDRPAILAD